jgi:hypothetical protein
MDPDKIIRDKSSTAIINTDIDALSAYRAKRDQRNKINELENDINSVKNDLLEIKNLLNQIIRDRG